MCGAGLLHRLLKLKKAEQPDLADSITPCSRGRELCPRTRFILAEILMLAGGAILPALAVPGSLVCLLGT